MAAAFYLFFSCIIIISIFKFLDFETTYLSDGIRSLISGNFIDFPSGKTHFDIKGNEESELVILVHGFSATY